MNSKDKRRAFLEDVLKKDYISSKEKLESVVENVIVERFKSVLRKEKK